MHRVCLLAALLAAAIPLSAYSQSRVSGRVLDAETGQPLPGVHVAVLQTTIGTTADREGNFDVQLPASARKLQFSLVGYRTLTRNVASAETGLTVYLEAAVLDLQPVVVSASREQQSRTEAPVAISSVPARRLEEMKPTMLSQVLNQVPGVHMTDLGNEQHNMSIRQPLSYKGLFVYLEDGIPIRPTGVFNHNALIEINMASLDGLEVVRGPSSALYGSNAVGGAVNFITPRPTLSPSGSAKVQGDNYGYRRGDFAASTTFGELGVYGGGYLARQRDGWAEHSDFDKNSLTLRADYGFTSTTNLTATFSSNFLDAETVGGLDSLNFYEQGYTTLHTFTYRKVESARARATLSHVWGTQGATDFTVFARRNAVGQLPHYRIRNNFQDPSQASGEINEDSYRSLGLDVQHEQYLGFLDARFIAGATLDRSPNSFYAQFIDIQRNPDTGRYVSYTEGDTLLTDYDVGLLNAGGYVQLDINPLERLKLVSSLRYDRIEYRFDNHLPPSAFSGAPDATDRFNRLSPRIGLTYDLGAGRGLYANYSRGFVPPEVSELYRGVKVPVLKPATFDSYEAGGWLAALDGRLYVDVSLYQMIGRNEIISVRFEDDSFGNANAGRTRHRGVEYAATYTPVQDLSLRFGGTNAEHLFVRHEDQGNVYDGNEMDAAPNWIANAEAVYRPRFLRDARIALEWQHLGPYYMDPANTKEYEGYDLFNLRLGYTWQGVEVWANVENLTDKLYANIASKTRFGQSYTPGGGRSVTFGIGYRAGGR
jgi:iron complex outermembrane recepter protein